MKKHQVQSSQECWHCHSQSNPARRICCLQIVLDIDLWLQFENFKDSGVMESLIRINKTIRTVYIGSQFFKISGPNPGQSSDISPLCREKKFSSLSFVRALNLFYLCTAAKWGKNFSFCQQTFKLLAFCFLASCILCWFRGSFYLSLLPHNTGFRFNSVLTPSWWFAVCSPFPTAPSAGDLVFQPVSLPQGKWFMSQPQGVAPGIGDWEDVSGAVLQTGLANLSLLCHHSPHQPWQCHTQSLGIRPFFWSHLAIPVRCILWLLALQIIRWTVKGENTEMQAENTVGLKKMVCPRNHRDAVLQICYWCFRQR